MLDGNFLDKKGPGPKPGRKMGDNHISYKRSEANTGELAGAILRQSGAIDPLRAATMFLCSLTVLLPARLVFLWQP